MTISACQIGDLNVANDAPFVLFGGMNVLESRDLAMRIAEEYQRVTEKLGIGYVFKASFDKANRSSMQGKRGVGFAQTMRDFREIKKELGVKILTDVHTEKQIKDIESAFSDCVDVLQIPAFLCRQTDLVLAACETNKIVNIKKGQFLAPWDMKGILEKTTEAREVWITERGTSFGYNTLVTDYTGVRYILDNFDAPVVMDCTHAVQKPGGLGGSSGGNREYAPFMAFAAAAVGVTDFFMEVHPDPDNAPSDGPNMIYLDQFESVVKKLKAIIDAANA